MRVYGIQMDLEWEAPAANRERAEAVLQRASPAPGSLVVLPEMFTTGFSMNAEAVAETEGGPTEGWASELARRLGIWLVAGWARRDSGGVAGNEALAFSPAGDRVAVYRKQRPFSPGGEHLHFAAGREPSVFRAGEAGVALFICYDLRFPELFRVVARNQAPELLVVIASWPATRISHWVALLTARAIENQAYVLGVNRVGADPAHAYPGRSLLVDPSGEIVADAGTGPGICSGGLDLARLRDYRQKLPFLRDA